jgi:hypothetical protein
MEYKRYQTVSEDLKLIKIDSQFSRFGDIQKTESLKATATAIVLNLKGA